MLPRPIVTLLRHEIGGFLSMVLLLRGRKDVPADATVIRNGSAQKTFLVVMMVLTPLEIVIVELLVPWAWLRVVLLVLALYGIVWMFGFYFGVHTRPHYVDSRQLVLRTGHLAGVSVDIGAVRAVRREYHGEYKGLVSVTDDVVALPGMNGSSMTVTLEPGTPVHIQGRGTVHAGAVRFESDDDAAAIRAMRERMGSPRE